jgi:ParB-like nuclease domain
MLMTPAKQSARLPFHPLANVLPLIEGVEFDQLVDSITENGLHDPIILFEGSILDGRNRYRACLEAGVEPRTETFSGGDPVAFVMDRNLHRRHLTVGEKAMALRKFATFSKGQTRAKLDAGIPASRTIAELAKTAGINKEAMSDANTIEADGTPEEIADVSNGKRAISAVANEVRKRRGGRKKGSTVLKRQLAIFERAISMLCNNCETAAELEIPKLDAEQRKTFDEQLVEAQRALRALRQRLNNGDQAHG